MRNSYLGPHFLDLVLILSHSSDKNEKKDCQLNWLSLSSFSFIFAINVNDRNCSQFNWATIFEEEEYIERQVDRQVERPSVQYAYTRQPFFHNVLFCHITRGKRKQVLQIWFKLHFKLWLGVEESNKERRKVRLLPNLCGPVHFLTNGSIRSFATTAHH